MWKTAAAAAATDAERLEKNKQKRRRGKDADGIKERSVYADYLDDPAHKM